MDFLQKIHQGDCIQGMNALPAGCVHLAFADPPFNIGYKYDVYQDRLESDAYLQWSRAWMAAVYRVLKPNGTFWLAIGDEYAAELKIESQKIGFHCRSWVIWYYTFGVNCTKKFTRSHAHLFHFVKDPEQFTFNESDPSNRVPSARQLVYNDKRANSKGRLPDDTWIIPPENTPGRLSAAVDHWLRQDASAPGNDHQTFLLRPQEMEAQFRPEEDTWYFPRVAGTFKERAGFHGCQMPEQLLGRIVRSCSDPGQIVLDPFAGSASTLVVARKLDRRFVGFELSPEYAAAGTERLEATRTGEALTGSAEPTMSTLRIGEKQVARSGARHKAVGQRALFDDDTIEAVNIAQLKAKMCDGVTRAFLEVGLGFSEERVITDPAKNEAFARACRAQGLAGDHRTWNLTLLSQRRRGRHADLDITTASGVSLSDCDDFLAAAEVASRIILDQERATTVTEILCDPLLAAAFDEIAARFAPRYDAFRCRWAAMLITTSAPRARMLGAVLTPPSAFGPRTPLHAIEPDGIDASPGVYLVSDGDDTVYVGETQNLQRCLRHQFATAGPGPWNDLVRDGFVQWFGTQATPGEVLAWSSCLVTRLSPRLNLPELCAVRADESVMDEPVASL